MHSFTDRTNRSWSLDINVAGIKRVRKLLNVDLLQVLDKGSELLRQLGTDLALLVDVLYALLKPDADAAGVSDEDFGRSFSGDSILHARTAFFEELTDFFPDPRARTLLAQVLQKSNRVSELVMKGTGEILDEVDLEAQANELLRMMRESVKSRAASGPETKSGNASESSDSTPDPTPSASSSTLSKGSTNRSGGRRRTLSRRSAT